MATAMDIVHCFKPQDNLDQAIYRDILKVKEGVGAEDFHLAQVNSASREVTLDYEVRRLPGVSQRGDYSSLGALALTSLLVARAVITRKPQHWTGALAFGAATMLGGEDTLRKARSAMMRLTQGGSLGNARLKIGAQEAVLTYRSQEVHMTLPPMKNVVLRTIRRSLGGRPTQSYAVHIDLQDGRILSLNRSEEPLRARRVGHQLAAALQLSMVFQNVEVTEVANGFSWEIGPQHQEPALN